VPHFVAVELGSPHQRSVVAHVLEKIKARGYELAGKLDGSMTWDELLAMTSTRGLFMDRLAYLVDDAEALGPFPSKFEGWLEGKGALNVVLLVYGNRCNAFPKKMMEKVTLIPSRKPPHRKKDRIKHIMDMAAEKGMTMTQEAAILLDEWIEDPEEMATEIEKLLLAESKTVTLDLVKELSKDEGSRALFRLLDGLCFKDEKAVILALKQVQKGAELLMVIAAIYNRLRLASFLASFGEKSLDALGARFYQSKMARVAAKLYDKKTLWKAVASLALLSGAEKMGMGRGWLGLELILLEMIRTQPPFSHQSFS